MVILQEFLFHNQNLRFQYCKPENFNPNWLYRESSWPYFQLHFDYFPYQEMLAEAIAVKHLFVDHRKKDKVHSYGHEGWKSLTLHGTAPDQTEYWSNYGYKSVEDANYHWTEIATMCPITTSFFQNNFPYAIFDRVRFMLLEAGGHIMPHTDGNTRMFGPINIALNNPIECNFIFENYGRVPYHDGSAFILDVGNRHALANHSNEDRYHIIVHGRADRKQSEFNQLIQKSYERNTNERN